VRLLIKAVCEELLPEAIGLTDAFGFTDWDLDRYGDFLAFSNLNLTIEFTKNPFSALGVYNGKVYEALWECAKAEPLNQTEIPAAYEVRKYDANLLLPSDSFMSHSQASIKPILERGKRLAAQAKL